MRLLRNQDCQPRGTAVVPRVATHLGLPCGEQRRQVAEGPTGGEYAPGLLPPAHGLGHPGDQAPLDGIARWSHLEHGEAVVEQGHGELRERGHRQRRCHLVSYEMGMMQVVGAGDETGDQLVEPPAGTGAETRRPGGGQLGGVEPRQHRHGGTAGGRIEVAGEPVDQLVPQTPELVGIERGANGGG